MVRVLLGPFSRYCFSSAKNWEDHLHQRYIWFVNSIDHFRVTLSALFKVSLSVKFLSWQLVRISIWRKSDIQNSSQVVVYCLFLSCMLPLSLFLFWLYFALRGRMARSQLDKQGKKTSVLPFFNPKVKIEVCEPLAHWNIYHPSSIP